MNSKKKTDIHLKILNALDIIDRFLIEDDESYLINQLLVFSDDIVIESIILFIEQRKFEKILLLSTFLSDIPKYPSLPYKLLEHMKTLDTDTDLLFRYYFFYSTLFLSGYGLSKNAIEIAEILDIDLDLYDVWINKKKKNFEKENDEFDPPNIFDVIEDIEPIKKSTSFNRDLPVFKPLKKVNFPLMEILDDLDEYYFNDTTREEFIQEIVDYEDLAQNKSEEKLIKSIVKHMDKGNYRYILNMYKKIEKLNLDNPAIFFLKAKTLENLKQTNYERPNFHPQYETLLKTLQYAKKMPKIEYYLDIALTVQMMGFFYASYILSLSLLRFLPMDTQLNLVAGYSAHQLMLPFKDFLFKGSIVEPVRMINFINEYWYPYRFKSQDNTKKYNIRKSTIESLKEEADKQWKNIPFHEFISVLDPEIFGFEFPYQDLLGISLQEICDYHEFDIKEEDLEWDDWDCTTINNVKEKGEIIIDPTSIDGDIFRTFEEFLEKKNQIFSECNQFYIKIVEDWLSSQEYLSLPKYTWKSRDNIIMTALSLNLEINGTLPPDWNWDDMEDILINTFSSRIDAPKYFFKSIGRVMQNFCTFLHKEKQYSNLKDFPNKIKKISKDIINASENLKN